MLVLLGSGAINGFLNDAYFNTVLLSATCLHMVIQASRANDEDPASWFFSFQNAMDYYMIWVYTAILCLRICCRGLLWHPDSFLQQPWSYLDLIIVVWAWLNTVYNFGNFMFFMFLRVVKLLVDSR